jgi:methylmalonyl-CoA mutase, N-terminal domain
MKSVTADTDKQRWERETLEPALKKAPERDVPFTTISGRPIDRLYTSDDIAELDPARDLASPGEFPYTRGIHPTGYRGKLWTMRQFAGFGTPEETNERYKTLLKAGGTGLSVAFDLPTLMGRDPDHELSLGEVGKCGVSIVSLADMERLFEGIDLGGITTSMTINSPAPMIFAMYLVVAEKQGADWKKLSGHDPERHPEGVHRPEGVHLPAARVDAAHHRHLRVLREGSAEVEHDLGERVPHPRGGVHVAPGAGLHAPRRHRVRPVRRGRRARRRRVRAPDLVLLQLAQRLLRGDRQVPRGAEALGRGDARPLRAKNERSWKLRFHTQTAGVSLTAQQPYNNVVRTALQALAAVLGGTNSLHTNSLDEALALPTAEAATLALRTQQVIAHESGVTNVVDPLGGSYFVERLTLDMERGAKEYFDIIDRMGGMVEAIEQGFPQKEIAEASYRFQQSVETREKIIVGVNGYVQEDEPPHPILYIDDTAYEKQMAALEQLRKTRDNDAVRRSTRSTRCGPSTGSGPSRAGSRDGNTMVPLLDCVRAYATVGEMCDALREVWGEYEEVPSI